MKYLLLCALIASSSAANELALTMKQLLECSDAEKPALEQKIEMIIDAQATPDNGYQGYYFSETFVRIPEIEHPDSSQILRAQNPRGKVYIDALYYVRKTIFVSTNTSHDLEQWAKVKKMLREKALEEQALRCVDLYFIGRPPHRVK